MLEEAWPHIVSFQTYSALGGLVTDWTFWIDRWNNVSQVEETLAAEEVGEFVEHPIEYHKYSQGIGNPWFHAPQR